MKISKLFYKIIIFLLCIVLSTICFSATAFAQTSIDINKKTSLTIKYPCEGATVRLYYVAEVTANGEYVFAEVFKRYPIDLKLNQNGWRDMASTLSGYVSRDQIKANQSGKTDSQGKIVFSKLPVGIYLVVSEKCISDNYCYVADPFLVALPRDSFGNWIYDVSASPKYDKKTTDTKIDLKAMKVWDDQGNTQKRPNYIEIQLLRNGVIWDTATLNEKNNWKFTWKNLNAKYTWQIVEKKVPAGYTVTVQSDNGRVIITNSSIDTPVTPVTPDEPEPQPQPRLPQTGVLWWPVGVLVISGLVILILGFIRRRETDEK